MFYTYIIVYQYFMHTTLFNIICFFVYHLYSTTYAFNLICFDLMILYLHPIFYRS